MIKTYKILTNKYDPSVTRDFLQLGPQSCTRGHSLKLAKSRPRLDLRKYSFTNRVVNMWNNLSEYIISAPSVRSFERRLDKFWGDQALKYNYEASITSTRRQPIDVGGEDYEDLIVEVYDLESEADL